MPYYKDLEVFQNVGDQMPPDAYNRYNFYLAMNDAKRFAEWQIFNTLFGKLNWQANHGPTLKGIRIEPSPVSRQEFYPNNLGALPKKDIIEVGESTEETQLKSHYFDSKEFHFYAAFNDFIENHVDPTQKDMTSKMAVAADQFALSVATQKVPHLYIPGNTTAGEDNLIPVTSIPSGTDITAATVAAQGKNPAFWAAMIQKIGLPGLSLTTLDDITCVLRDDLAAPAFEGVVNQPKDNELIKGKYVGVGSFEAFQCLKYDPMFARFRNVNFDVVTSGFRGAVFDALTWKFNRFPQRFKADGTQPAPQLIDAASKKMRPNPEYTAAPYELMWFFGADFMKTIKVGPPPKPFTKKMSGEKFHSMDWNGVVYTTDDLHVNYIDGQGNTVTENNYRGHLLKLYSTVVYGALPVECYNAVPVLFRRRRPSDFATVEE